MQESERFGLKLNSDSLLLHTDRPPQKEKKTKPNSQLPAMDNLWAPPENTVAIKVAILVYFEIRDVENR